VDFVSRNEALARGLKRYFTGCVCPNGHLAERYVSCFACVECQLAPDRKDKKIEGRQRRRKAVQPRRGKTYFTGIPCRRGHIAERFVSNETCVACAYEAAKIRRKIAPYKQRLHGRRWYAKAVKANRERVYMRSVRRRARLLNAAGVYTPEDIQRIYRLQKGRCAYCRKNLGTEFERDHIVPLSKGGTNHARNIQILCRFGCNQSKHSRDPIEFARSNGWLI
jgi:5-methylcytosine-specific restriction endonuclease McrA